MLNSDCYLGVVGFFVQELESPSESLVWSLFPSLSILGICESKPQSSRVV